MNRTLTIFLVAGALVSVGCTKKQSTESSGSLLSGSASDEEEDDGKRERGGVRDNDPTNQGGPNTQGPGRRIPR